MRPRKRQTDRRTASVWRFVVKATQSRCGWTWAREIASYVYGHRIQYIELSVESSIALINSSYSAYQWPVTLPRNDRKSSVIRWRHVSRDHLCDAVYSDRQSTERSSGVIRPRQFALFSPSPMPLARAPSRGVACIVRRRRYSYPSWTRIRENFTLPFGKYIVQSLGRKITFKTVARCVI